MNIKFTPPNIAALPGGCLSTDKVELTGCAQMPLTVYLAPNAYRIDRFMSAESADKLVSFMSGRNMAPVSIQGMQEITPDTIGSHRCTMWNESLAKEIEGLFKYVAFARHRCFSDLSPTDWWQGDKSRRLWDYAGVSPMIRYMEYEGGGKHACHYDAGFIAKDDSYRTLMSFVLYLSDNNTGATRIINDGQNHIPIWDRNLNDWDRDVLPKEVVATSLPTKGSLLLFDHRVPHDVEEFKGPGKRIIIRGDLMFTYAP